jgi:hypothetical protein
VGKRTAEPVGSIPKGSPALPEPSDACAVRSVSDQDGDDAMSKDHQHRIRERAHAIWEREGRPHGTA